MVDDPCIFACVREIFRPTEASREFQLVVELVVTLHERAIGVVERLVVGLEHQRPAGNWSPGAESSGPC